MGRRLGQHFLADPAILERIVDALDPAPTDRVLEVGPGRGTLTTRLAARVGHVVTIEKDHALADALRARSESNVTVIAGDALRIPWRAAVGDTPFKVVGNIPYYITSPLIEKALDAGPRVIVYLVQKEVADRVVAAPGGKVYGALSVGVQAVARGERLFVVKAGSFQPVPKVDSAVIRITPRDDPLVEGAERARFRSFVTALFSQRRKQIVNGATTASGLPRAVVLDRLAVLAIAPQTRPEMLGPESLVGLFEALMR